MELEINLPQGCTTHLHGAGSIEAMPFFLEGHGASSMEAYLNMCRLLPAAGTCCPLIPSRAGGLVTLTHDTLVTHLKTLLHTAGFPAARFSGHSFRRGGATYAWHCGADPATIKLLGDWSSDAYERYLDSSLEQPIANRPVLRTPPPHLVSLIFPPGLVLEEKYCGRRKKNSVAAKRLRDARRIKENQVTLRASFLEMENATLKEEELLKAKEENLILSKKLLKYERQNRV
ncbi:hypothetical protein Bbelb_313140 [Branchiostoma belcheri]|nr:hypothetical protein Bbelb_313140 [Branchiostoma belcheri]